ncbi:hypothetical protein Patl1_23400 [Pistacia atlantica]|uniref:Uncharacterized protein n=1 Tax=Pistacia atlantica TaxID=434234 RepID=A0ACC0ZVQ7_9ROSI|nr:hypothetical protein Patl1_23400 [Pistacia atlantica]
MTQAVEEWYKQMPIITCTYLTAGIVTTNSCSLDIISPFNLCLHPTLVVKQYQFWRLITNFLFFRQMVKFLIDIGKNLLLPLSVSFASQLYCLRFTVETGMGSLACKGRHIKYTSTLTQILHSNSNVLVCQNL